MLSWEQIITHIRYRTCNFNGLSIEELLKYYIVLQMQIKSFEEMDEGNYVAELFDSNYHQIQRQTENIFISVADTAKYAYHCKILIAQEAGKHTMSQEEYDVLTDKCVGEYEEQILSKCSQTNENL